MRRSGGWGWLGLGCALTSALACGDSARIIGWPEPDLDGGADVAGSPTPPGLTDTDANWVFDGAALREYQLTLAPEAWDALRASAIEEKYVPAELSVDGAPFGTVGVRYKGSRRNIGRCIDASGNVACLKLSMKLKFDEYAEGQLFFGLKRLNFNSMRGDPTSLREQLVYKLFREMGVAAPRAAHALVSVNGEDLGVFAMIEQIDGRFTDDRFAGGDGNLYKEQWPITGNVAALNATLRTNEETADHSALVRFHADLVAAAPEALPDVLARYMDIDQLMAYLAVDRVTTNWDGFTGFYCRGRGCYNHNYYLYQHEHEDRFTLIPWDLDNTFRLWTPFEMVGMPLTTPGDCPTYYPLFGEGVMAPGCDPLFRALGQVDRARYRVQLERLIAGPFDIARVNAWIDERLEQLLPYIERDSRGRTVETTRAWVDAMRGDLPYLAQRAMAEHDGTPLPHFRLAADGINDFESISPLTLQLGVDRQTAPETRVAPAIREGIALDGQRDLEMSFAFPPGGEAEERWVRLRLPFDGDLIDIGAKTSLRLVIQSDGPRTVRIGIDSDVYSSGVFGGPVFGWDVVVDGTRQTIELPLATASYPASAPPVPETLADVLGRATALLVDPQRVGPSGGALPSSSAPDSGRIYLDQITLSP
jgi:spore coat protein H